MKYSDVARAVVASISARKERLEVAPPIADLAWQYASGMVYGAREVLAAIEVAESGGSSAAPVCPECQKSPCVGHPALAERPEMCKGGGSEGADE
jgi:hypothetical protein